MAGAGGSTINNAIPGDSDFAKQEAGGGPTVDTGSANKYTLNTKDLMKNPNNNKAKNRARDNTNGQKSTVFTASFSCVGFTDMEGKTCVDIKNVGTMGSGVWYIKSLTVSWAATGQASSTVSLVSGLEAGGQSAGKTEDQPMVCYGETSNKRGDLYMGPRKIDGAVTETFDFWKDNYSKSFSYVIDMHNNKGGARGTHGTEVNLQNPKEMTSTSHTSGDTKAKNDSKNAITDLLSWKEPAK